MKERVLRSRGYSIALAALALLACAIWVVASDATSPARDAEQQEAPALFGAPPRCPAGTRPLVRARRLEQQGHLHAERYPYDPRDGIRAVLRLREAESCYRAAGLDAEAERLGDHASELVATLGVDYASSRLVLQNALEAEKWSLARTELHRLLRLTGHVKGHRYVDWLERVSGKVAVRASTHD